MKGYSRDANGDVVLTMSEEDYERLLFILGTATGISASEPERSVLTLDGVILLVNRLNHGNPEFMPYKVPRK